MHTRLVYKKVLWHDISAFTLSPAEENQVSAETITLHAKNFGYFILDV